MVWWTETPQRNRRSLARRTPIREGAPRRVPLDPPRVSQSALLESPDQLAGAEVIPFALSTPDEATSLSFVERRSQRGSVGLDQPSSEAEPSVPEPGLAARGVNAREVTPGDPSREPRELSLAKRLTSLLQAPVESFLTGQ